MKLTFEKMLPVHTLIETKDYFISQNGMNLTFFEKNNLMLLGKINCVNGNFNLMHVDKNQINLTDGR
jgi:hypothetical protein